MGCLGVNIHYDSELILVLEPPTLQSIVRERRGEESRGHI